MPNPLCRPKREVAIARVARTVSVNTDNPVVKPIPEVNHCSESKVIKTTNVPGPHTHAVDYFSRGSAILILSVG